MARFQTDLHRRVQDLKNQVDVPIAGTGKGDGFSRDFRRFPIKFPDGVSAPFFPMRNAQGQSLIQSRIIHRSTVARGQFACTREIPGFNGLCVFCHYAREEKNKDKNDRVYGVGLSLTYFVPVWDPNYWIPVKDKPTDKYENYVLWQPRHSEMPVPERAELGKVRFFQLGGYKQWPEFESYCNELEKTCRCVLTTRSSKVSKTYYRESRCPECQCVLHTIDDLNRMDETGLRAAFDTGRACKEEEEGGCWTEDRARTGRLIYPEPVYGCNNKQCQNPTPLSPFDGPAQVRRSGVDKETTYVFTRAEELSEWIDNVPDEARKAFANGFDVNKVLFIMGLEKQAKFLNAPYPFDEESKKFKQERAKQKVEQSRRPDLEEAEEDGE